MQYLNNSFWRMVVGLAFILVMGVVFLVVSQNYSSGNKVSPENYVAGSKGE